MTPNSLPGTWRRPRDKTHPPPARAERKNPTKHPNLVLAIVASPRLNREEKQDKDGAEWQPTRDPTDPNDQKKPCLFALSIIQTLAPCLDNFTDPAAAWDGPRPAARFEILRLETRFKPRVSGLFSSFALQQRPADLVNAQAGCALGIEKQKWNLALNRFHRLAVLPNAAAIGRGVVQKTLAGLK